MDPLRLHYGLGNASQIESITIKWPSLDTLTNSPKIMIIDGPINVNQNYHIVEDIGFVGKKGDANFDDYINVIDIVNIVSEILEPANEDPLFLWACDLNYSLDINVIDITKLISFILAHQ